MFILFLFRFMGFRCQCSGYAIVSTFPDTRNLTPDVRNRNGVKSKVYVHHVTGEIHHLRSTLNRQEEQVQLCTFNVHILLLFDNT